MKKQSLLYASLLAGLFASCQSEVPEMTLDKEDEARVSFAVDFNTEDAVLTRAEHNFEYYIAISSDAADGENITSGYVGRFTSLSDASIALKKGTEYSFYISAFEDAGYTPDLSSYCLTQGEFVLVDTPTSYAPAFADQKVDRYFGSTSQTITTSTTIAVNGTRFAYGINVNIAPPLEGKVVLSSESPAFLYTVLSTDEAIVESNIFCLAGIDPEASKSIDVTMNLYNADGSAVATTTKTLNIARNHSKTVKVTALDPNANFSFSVDDDNMEDDGEEDMNPEVSQNMHNGHEYVDLGLPSGTLWATCNVGAEKPWNYGDYFAWGETEPYYTEGHVQDSPCTNWQMGKTSGYVWASYKWCNSNYKTMSKYNVKSDYGTVDNKTVLETVDDAACQNWGGTWRMPTQIEFQELKNNCTWSWTTQNSVNGYKVTGPNGNWIFLPAAGYRRETYLNNEGSYGYYVVSTLNALAPNEAFYQCFSSSDIHLGYTGYRWYGRSIRPIIVIE